MQTLSKKVKIICITLAAVVLLSVLGFFVLPAGLESCNPNGIKIDKTKTQLYVRIHDGGYGTTWLTNLSARFEEAYADYPGEDGKVGVQIIPDANKNIIQDVSDITGSRNEVFMIEQFSNYIEFVKAGAFIDITDVVTEQVDANKTDYNPDGTILGRYTEEQEAFYNIDNKYYGIPHYASYSGFHYDVDLWEREYPLCLYLDDNGKFVTDAKNVSLRSKGPDNIKGTHDDGLPATYDEFFKVFDRMVATQVTPIIWSGFSQGYYWNTLCNLQANADGFDNYYLNYSLSGKANNIVESVTLGSNFESTVLKVNEKDITDENAYLLFGSSGRYYASKFMEKIITNYNKYVYFDSFSPTHSHLDAQYDFIASKYDTTQKPIGMIIEGTWWENEVSARFEDMAVVYGEEASRKGRNFAFLPYPLPKKLADGETHQNILLNNGATHSFINSSIDESKVELAKDFLRFFYTEKELINFTLETNTSIGLKYELSDEQLKELSPYGRSLLLTVMNSKVLYQYSQNPVFLNNITNLQQSSTWQAEIETSLGLVTKTDMMNAYRYDDTSAEDYFWGMVEKYDKEWWQNNII